VNIEGIVPYYDIFMPKWTPTSLHGNRLFLGIEAGQDPIEMFNKYRAASSYPILKTCLQRGPVLRRD
jgi:hypothetical protein